MKKTLIPVSLAFILLLGSVGVAKAAALTQSQINAIIGLLRSFGADEGTVANVNSVLVGTGTSGGTAWCHTFNTNLKIGDIGDEVSALQTALQKEGFSISSDEMAQTGGTLGVAYSVPANFGESTASAVTGFQEKYRSEILTPLGLKYGTGFVGKATRAKLNQLYGCGVMPPVGAGYLQIEPSSASIAVGESKSFYASYQPPMTPCPSGTFCAQVMPAPIPVVAEWTSSNPGIASITTVAIGDCFTPGCNPFNGVAVKGNSNGTADIKAAYRPSYGDGREIMMAAITATAKVTVGSGSSNPSITVFSPNGGETWTKGTTQTIKWQDNTPIPICPVGAQCAPQAPKYYNIKLIPYVPPCTTNLCPAYYPSPYTIAKSVSGFSYNWLVGKYLDVLGTGASGVAPDGSYTVQVCQTGTSLCDSSDSYFRIVTGGTTINSPPVINGIPAIPSNIKVGQSVSFSWGATDADGDNLSWGVSWGEGTGVAGACQSPNPQNKQGWTFNTSHAWASPGTYTVKATVNDCRGGSNEHAFNVTVGSTVTPSVTVLSPNGGEVWQRGQNVVIKWNSTNAPTVMVDLVRPGYEYHLTGPTGDIVNTGSLQYMVPADMQVASDYRIRVMHRVNAVPVAEDFSDTPFSIATATTQSPVTVLSPNGGEVLQKGTPMTIKWNYDGNYGERSVRIDLVDANPSYGSAPNPVLLIANYIPINSNNSGPTNSGSYTWTIPTTVLTGSNYKIRLMVSGTEGYIDESDAPFTISGIFGL